MLSRQSQPNIPSCGDISRLLSGPRDSFCEVHFMDEIVRVCVSCGTEFTISRSRLKHGRGKYCSRSCYRKGKVKWHVFVCVVCGKKRRLSTRVCGKRTERYCSPACSGIAHSGNQHPLWNGGVYKKPSGYLMEYAGPGIYERQHRLIMERHLGRRLGDDEVVHHVNDNKADNRLENLEVMTKAEHARLHSTRRWKERKSL